MAVTTGTPAPEFALLDQHGQRRTLASFLADRPLFLVFYPLAFSPVCHSELTELQQRATELDELGVTMATVSVDSIHTQRAFAEASGFDFAMLADFWPHGETARRYGVFNETAGHAKRVSFLIGRDGVVRATVCSGAREPRGFDDYRHAVLHSRRYL